jgi:hypothetical protein
MADPVRAPSHIIVEIVNCTDYSEVKFNLHVIAR